MAESYTDYDEAIESLAKTRLDLVKETYEYLGEDSGLVVSYKRQVYNNEVPFNVFRNKVLEANNIDELQYYTKNVNQELKDYIKKNIFPEYEKNDGGHNIVHIL